MESKCLALSRRITNEKKREVDIFYERGKYTCCRLYMQLIKELHEIRTRKQWLTVALTKKGLYVKTNKESAFSLNRKYFTFFHFLHTNCTSALFLSSKYFCNTNTTLLFLKLQFYTINRLKVCNNKYEFVPRVLNIYCRKKKNFFLFLM